MVRRFSEGKGKAKFHRRISIIMSFNWLDFYRLAGQLKNQTTDEAALRSAISRAYYTTYHLADERRKSNNIPLPALSNAGSHLRLWYLFRNHHHGTCRKVGIDGDRLRRRRQTADYDAVIKNIQSEVNSAMREAHILINSITSMPANLP